MTVTAPPRPPRPSDPVTHGEFDALVEALIEARQRGQRRRRHGAIVTLVALAGVALFALLGRSAQSQTAMPQGLSARSSLAAAAATSKIAFISEGHRGGYCGTVWVMNPDGSRQRRLTNGGVAGCGQEWGHTWSPDGRQIAFVGDGIQVMNADGSGQRRLTSDTGFESNPAWSPDGRRIAFTGGRDGNARIYVINADGTEQRLLMPAAASYFSSPAWSPNGEKIAFDRTPEGPRCADPQLGDLRHERRRQRAPRLTRITEKQLCSICLSILVAGREGDHLREKRAGVGRERRRQRDSAG